MVEKTGAAQLRGIKFCNQRVAAYVGIGGMAHSHHENHDSYRLYRAKSDGFVSVFNQDGFFMAEYNPVTGATAWHRVVPATKRESIERQLAAQFPAVVKAQSLSNKLRSKPKRR